RARDAAETIAVRHVEATVAAVLADRLAQVARNSRSIFAVTRYIGFFTVGYNYLIQLLPILIVAPLYLRGDVEFGVVTQAAMAFAQVLGAFSLIVTQFEPISAFAAVAERLNTIGDVIVEARHAPRTTAIRMVEDDGRLGFEGLSLWTPQEHRLLVQDLSVSLQQGSTLLITGPNTAAAGALVMAAAGVWAEGEGRITRPPPDLVHFVPQRPFAAPGTLRAQLLLTNPLRTFTDEQLLAALRAVGLDALVARVGGLDGAMDWAGNLSPGEQHLLAFARVLLASPRFVFLDRVFGALSPDQLEHLYRLLSESSITYISVGDEQGLLAYHHLVLELRDEGGWRITTAMGALVE
ncbi:MAG TPA: SbmA/BacA-like family transporter, partial [Isosphaeraceae bacterium]